MDYIIVALLVILIVVILIVLNRTGSMSSRLRRLELGGGVDEISELRRELVDGQRGQRQEVLSSTQAVARTLSEQLSAQTMQLENRLRSVTLDSEQRLKQLYEGLGEMRTLAEGVGDLKKILGNVKTRGILGEVQLGAILEDILAPQQYEANVMTKVGSRAVVEYAVKLPGEGGGAVWLPIDAKFPADAYSSLRDAADSGDSEAVKVASSVLQSRLKLFAKDIRDRYVDPPHTTDFAIMFLPFEGLYAEVASSGLIETLQRDYRISVAGPSTMAAILNSLQMGFRTLAIQKRSNEVWTILGEVRTEFERFAEVLTATQSRIAQAEQELDKLVGVRTRAVQRKLAAIDKDYID